MTHEDAFQEIGIAPGSSPDEIRRAYLRLVKVRKPESDPEGFRRLREAFELLRGLPEAPPEIRPHPRPVKKRPDHPKAESAETAAPEEALPPPRHVVRLILELQAEGQTAEAERLQDRLQRRLRSSSRELSLLDEETAALWQIVRELSGLSADFPMPVRAAISSAVLRGAPGLALPRLLAQAGEDGDVGWRMAAEIEDLPGLGSLYHDALIDALRNRSWRRRPPVESSSWSPFKVIGALIGVWFLAQASTSLMRPSTSQVRSLPYPFSDRSLRGAAAAPYDPAEPAREVMLLACPPGALDVAGQAEFCQAVQTAFVHLSERRCHEVHDARKQILEGLQTMRGSALEQPAQELFDALRIGYIDICRNYSF